MHELTLLFGVAGQIEQVVKENGLDHVDAVVLDIGDLTAVVPEFMYDGYSVVSDDFDFLRGSQLIINTIKGVGICRECGNEFEIVENEGVCPECGSTDKDLISGQEFTIREVRIMEH